MKMHIISSKFELGNNMQSPIFNINFNHRTPRIIEESQPSFDIIEYPIVNIPTITLRSSFILCNPAMYPTNAYRESWPEDLPYPQFLRPLNPIFTRCELTDKRLNLTSNRFDVNCYVKLWDCQDSREFVSEIDNWLSGRERESLIVNAYTYSPYIQPYVEEMTTNLARLHTFSTIPDLPIDEDEFYEQLYDLYQGERLDLPPGLSHNCPTFEATSLIEACKGFGYGMYHSMFSNKDNASQLQALIERWIIEIADLAVNFSVYKLVFSFVKLLQEFIPLTTLLKQVSFFMKSSFSYLTDKLRTKSSTGATQPLSAQDTFEATSNFSDVDLYDLIQYDKVDYAGKAVALAAGLTSVICLLGVSIVGYKATKSASSMNALKEFSDVMYTVSKTKNGLYAVKAMVTDLKVYLKDFVSYYVYGSKASTIANLVKFSKVEESEDCKKDKFFDYMEFCLTPQNVLVIQQNKVYQNQMNFCYKILYELNQYFANDDAREVPEPIKSFVRHNLVELKKVVTVVNRKSNFDQVRFVPFWCNILGKSGTGKSTFCTLLTNTLHDVLEKELKDEIPAKDNWMYSINFNDQYYTNYKGQYVVCMDDFGQDAKPVGTNKSSHSEMISLVSGVPYSTQQASVEDKGIPFTSKIIISTSNDFNMNRSEIIDCTALRRRQNMCIAFVEKDDVKPDPLLGGKKIQIQLRHSLNVTQILTTYDSAKTFLIDFVKRYLEWHKLQEEVMKTRTPDPNLIQDILQAVKPQVVTVEPQVEATTSWRCLAGMDPNVVDSYGIEQFDCDCDYHTERNLHYHSTIRLYQAECVRYTGIKDFYSHEFPPSFFEIKNQFTNNVKELGARIKDFMKNNMAKLAFAAAGAIVAFFLVRPMLTSGDKEEDEVEEENHHFEETKMQYTPSVKRAPKKRAFIATNDDFEQFEASEPFLPSSVDDQAQDLIQNVLLRRGLICRLEYVNTGTARKQTNTAIRVKGTAILTNHHFMAALSKGDEFVIKINTLSGISQSRQKYDPQRCVRIGESDLVIYNCDSSMSNSKDILKHFPDSEVLTYAQDALIVTAYGVTPMHVVKMNVLATPTLHQKGIYEANGESYTILDSYQTNCQVEKGMSGSVLISNNPKLKTKILGIQTCRNQQTGHGYFKPVSRTQVEKALEALNPISFEEEELEITSAIIDDRCPPNLGKTSLQYLGTLPKTKYLRASNKTKLTPSLVQNADQLTQLPSVLDDNDERMDEEFRNKSVIFRSFQGFDEPIGSIDQSILTRALNQLKVEYDVVLENNKVPRRLLSMNEMINGVPGVINRIEMKSSPGYPYILQRKNTTLGGKYEWFEEIETLPGYGKTYSPTSTLLSGLKQREELMLKGIKPPTIAYACLKDETRPIKKISSGATRTFLCLPLDYNLLIRKYFGAFVAALHQKSGIVTSCVGIDPATQWRDLYDKLMSKNGMWEDFDYTAWDQHLHPSLVLAVASLVNYYYGDADDSPVGKLRYMLLYDLVFTLVIVKDRLFRKSSGQCSGCAITAELNCIVHDLLMYYVWLLINQRKGRPTNLTDYREHVASIMYGDDIVQSVEPETNQWFNGKTIQPYMQDLGMNITPGDKVSTDFVAKPPSEILFLKRSFRKDGELIKAPLRSDIVYNITQWIHKSDNPAEATRVNCETALQEAYMHGEKYFRELAQDINDRIKTFVRQTKTPLPPVLVDYEEFDKKYHDQEFTCSGLITASVRNVEDW